MQVVINIPDEYFNDIKRRHKNGNPVGSHYLERIVNLGNPLPKGHGRLIDGDIIDMERLYRENDDGSFSLIYTKDEFSTIIEADKEGWIW